jgi:mRNA interferase MazF
MMLMMRSGMMFKQGDILLIPVPFTDLTTNKQRPVLVLSNDIYNQNTDDILVSAITSQLKGLDFSVVINTENLTEGELKKTSAIRADKLYTLSKQIVKKKFGHVQNSILDEVIVKINELLYVSS